jgi:phosphatidylglycerophosphatase A
MKPGLLWRGVAWPQSAPERPSVRLLARPAVLIASVGGAGFVPIAPGTAGSLLGIPLGLVCSALSPLLAVLLFALLVAIGAWAAGGTGKLLGKYDHQIIVLDETVAMALVVFCIPKSAVSLLAGFLLFRIFDVIKPWPANILEHRLQNGLGVMADDLIAALYAIGIVQGAQFAILRFFG